MAKVTLIRRRPVEIAWCPENRGNSRLQQALLTWYLNNHQIKVQQDVRCLSRTGLEATGMKEHKT